MLLRRKCCFNLHVLNLLPGFIYFLFESFSRVGTKDKPLMRTENSSSVKLWLERS